jgi:5-oxoprolinase (ATP-hydrolysing)
LEFLDDLEVALLSQRRGTFVPYGLQGGKPGKKGRNLLHPRQGAPQELEGLASFHVAPGDTLVVKTPGGGGFGSVANSHCDDGG